MLSFDFVASYRGSEVEPMTCEQVMSHDNSFPNLTDGAAVKFSGRILDPCHAFL